MRNALKNALKVILKITLNAKSFEVNSIEFFKFNNIYWRWYEALINETQTSDLKS